MSQSIPETDRSTPRGPRVTSETLLWSILGFVARSLCCCRHCLSALTFGGLQLRAWCTPALCTRCDPGSKRRLSVAWPPL